MSFGARRADHGPSDQAGVALGTELVQSANRGCRRRYAGVVELVDAPDSKSGSVRSVGSIPTARTTFSSKLAKVGSRVRDPSPAPDYLVKTTRGVNIAVRCCVTLELILAEKARPDRGTALRTLHVGSIPAFSRASMSSILK